MKLNIAGWIAAALLAACVSVHAQTYPAGEMRVVVGLPAGSGGDVVARFYADKLSQVCVPKIRFCNIAGEGHRELGVT